MSSKKNQPKSLKYIDAGVDISEGEALVKDITPHALRTKRAGSDNNIGGFGGLFDIQAAGFKDPILVASADGVGTKLELAKATGSNREVGVDLVAMCVNDILAQGAMPLFFLDYFATGRLDRPQALEVVAGIADACVESNCALIGGETAEMPGMYPVGSFDLAGFCVGAAERGNLLSPEIPKVDDIAIGLPSSGIHSNGYSLVRKILEISGLCLNEKAPFKTSSETLGAALMEPTRIYQKAVKIALSTGGVSGIVHITGGGLIENPPRVYRKNICFRLDCATLPLPGIFAWLRDTGKVSATEIARTFNCGIGLIIFVRAEKVDNVLAALQLGQEPDAKIIGKLEERSGARSVVLENLENWTHSKWYD